MPTEDTIAALEDTFEADVNEVCRLLDLLSDADALVFERSWRFALAQIENANEGALIDNEIPKMLAELREIVGTDGGA